MGANFVTSLTRPSVGIFVVLKFMATMHTINVQCVIYHVVINFIHADVAKKTMKSNNGDTAQNPFMLQYFITSALLRGKQDQTFIPRPSSASPRD